MTDITELARILKAAAEKATPGPWRRASTIFNGITRGKFSLTKEDILANANEKRDAEFIALANPANILALVEALEKAQRYIKELREWNADLAQESFTYQKRMAELESRTVTVWMPKLYQTSCSEAEKYLEPIDVEQAILSAGADAGLKIDIEWETE